MSTPSESFVRPEYDVNGAPYNPDLSPFYQSVIARPETKANCFILPENATGKSGDFWWDFIGCYWQRSNYQGILGVQARECPSVLAAYCRPISNDLELYARMQEYASKYGGQKARDEMAKARTSVKDRLSAAMNRRAELDAEIARLETAAKAEEEIKVGDWVVALENCGGAYHKDGLYLVKKSNSGLKGYVCTVADDYGSTTNAWGKHKFRKATPAEISAHLARVEAEKKVTVHSSDGGNYTAEYRRGYVQFGCAQISNDILRDVAQFVEDHRDVRLGNRRVESVLIGRGTFTHEILQRLVKNLLD